MDTFTTDQAKKELEENFGKKVTVIQIKCLEQLKVTDQIGPADIDSVYTELLCTLIDRLDLGKDWKDRAANTYVRNLPINILCYKETTSLKVLLGENWISHGPLFNINTLAVVGTVDDEAVANANAIPFFHGSEDGRRAYIDFLKGNKENKKKQV